jgi:predicted Fe-S protein YdhL (DUF1289 family)
VPKRHVPSGPDIPEPNPLSWANAGLSPQGLFSQSLTAMPAVPRLAESDPPSPCLRLCRLDGEVCLGCGRRIDEIVAWPTASAAARHAILLMARARLAAIPDRSGVKEPV